MPAGAGESEVFAPGLLKDRVALVTGGGTGLGKATALELARCGAQVLIGGRRTEVLEAAVDEATVLLQDGPGAGALDWSTVDVRDRESADQLVGTTLDRHG